MHVFGYFLGAVAILLDWVLLIYMWVIIIRALLSWVSPDPYNPIVRFIHSITEPVLYKIRSKIHMFYGGIDFSPIIVILAIYFFRYFAVSRLFRFSQSLLS